MLLVRLKHEVEAFICIWDFSGLQKLYINS